MKHDGARPETTPAQRELEAVTRLGAALTRPTPDSPRHRAALRAAAFALFPIMEREGMGDIERASAGELATAAIAEYERVMQGGEICV